MHANIMQEDPADSREPASATLRTLRGPKVAMPKLARIPQTAIADARSMVDQGRSGSTWRNSALRAGRNMHHTETISSNAAPVSRAPADKVLREPGRGRVASPAKTQPVPQAARKA